MAATNSPMMTASVASMKPMLAQHHQYSVGKPLHVRVAWKVGRLRRGE